MSHMHLVPTGAVLVFAGASAPGGFLLCDGSPVSRTTYAALFAAIGSAHGSGDGSTTFNLPDYRGRFIRGVDSTAGRDPDKASRTAMATGGNTGNAVGSVQTQATAPNGLRDQGHSHGLSNNVGLNARPNGSGDQGWFPTTNAPLSVSQGNASLVGDNETRPINAYANFIIKY
jgi:phage-related tail fiber protein